MNWQVTVERGYELVRGTVSGWFETLIRHLPNVIVAVLVVVLTYFIARLARGSVKRILARTGVPVPVTKIIGGLSYTALIGLGFFIALTVLNLDKTVTSILAGAGVIGLALSFAFQDLASNFISGLFITLQRPLRVGDLVKTNNFIGHVNSIGLRSLTIRDLDGQHIIIPSKDIFQAPMINYSLDGRRRVQLEVGVTYAADLQKVEDIVGEAIRALPMVQGDEPLTVDWHTFGDSSINFTARFWIGDSEQSSYNRALSEALKAVKRTFKEHKVTIPFPIRTIDFGIEGGQRATEVVDHTLERLNVETRATGT